MSVSTGPCRWSCNMARKAFSFSCRVNTVTFTAPVPEGVDGLRGDTTLDIIHEAGGRVE